MPFPGHNKTAVRRKEGKPMSSMRIERTNEEIRSVLADLLREVKDPRVQQGMISITSVETTGDLRYCKVYVSVYGMKDEKEFMRGIRSASGWLRRELGARLSLRAVPELIFTVDHSIEHGAHINDLLNHLNIEHSGDEEK